MHYANRMTESAVLSSMVDKVSKTKLMNSSESLKYWRIDNFSLVWIDFYESVNGVSEVFGTGALQRLQRFRELVRIKERDLVNLTPSNTKSPQ